MKKLLCRLMGHSWKRTERKITFHTPFNEEVIVARYFECERCPAEKREEYYPKYLDDEFYGHPRQIKAGSLLDGDTHAIMGRITDLMQGSAALERLESMDEDATDV